MDEKHEESAGSISTPKIPTPQALTQALSEQLASMYRLGGLALVFVFIGVATMFVGHVFTGQLSIWIFGVGALTTLVCLGLFAYAQLSTPVKEARQTRKEREMASALEEVTVDLTKATGALQALAFKHLPDVNKVLQNAKPVLAYLPKDFAIADFANVASVIVEIHDRVDKVVWETRDAVRNADADRLRSYAAEIRQITRELKKALGSKYADEKLAEAVSKGDADAVKNFIDMGADPNQGRSGAPLIRAISNSDHNSFRLLLSDAKADPNIRGGQKKTALMMAAEKGDEEMVKDLIGFGAGVNLVDQNGMTALIRAAREGHEAIVEFLLSSGAALDAKDQNNMTALEHARNKHHERIVEILTRHTSDSKF